MAWLDSRRTIFKVAILQALCATPLVAIAAIDRPVLSFAAAAVSIVAGVFGFRLVGRASQRQLIEAIAAWRDGEPFRPLTARWPAEYVALAHAVGVATTAMSEREEELRTATRQQQLLMQEIHHRVKNNLQIVASLLNLQANRIKVPAAQAEFQSARDRVRALATLHRHLYAHSELQTINLREFLTELCGQLFSAFGETPGARIDLHVDAPELEMSSDQAVPLALIVTETVSNSVKFAFPDGRRGAIDIRLSSDGGEAELVVSDNGVGMEAGSPDGAADGLGRRDGIGLQLIRGFARQLGGTLAVEDDVGTSYTVRMPLQRDRAVVSSLGVRPAA